MTSPLKRLNRLVAAGIRRLREQVIHEAQAELNRQLDALHRPRGTVRPAHICAPAWAAAGARRGDDPLEQLWKLPARRPRRRLAGA